MRFVVDLIMAYLRGLRGTNQEMPVGERLSEDTLVECAENIATALHGQLVMYFSERIALFVEREIAKAARSGRPLDQRELVRCIRSTIWQTDPEERGVWRGQYDRDKRAQG